MLDCTCQRPLIGARLRNMGVLGLALASLACRPDTGKDSGGDTAEDLWSGSGSDGGSGSGSGSGGSGSGGSGGCDEQTDAPQIIDGLAIYSDAGSLGWVAYFQVTVVDRNDDVFGGLFQLTLNGGTTYDYAIDNDETDWDAEDGTVRLTFSNVDPVRYDVELRVVDTAGNPSNVWRGVIDPY